ncbi:hypothetical protein K470DRAFT_271476 [Piedraia hortae CBS 480.64]|uniref:Uncharacterized protein n=1 Tax=Piedraia hortae CBS 480.64 TaxID=1314780 RepID=A0A6A7BY14_9PEZI|nr:hypothetical protein K470DRAFT_271476 [Piedraia hortae CBS 480.64]
MAEEYKKDDRKLEYLSYNEEQYEKVLNELRKGKDLTKEEMEVIFPVLNVSETSSPEQNTQELNQELVPNIQQSLSGQKQETKNVEKGESAASRRKSEGKATTAPRKRNYPDPTAEKMALRSSTRSRRR